MLHRRPVAHDSQGLSTPNLFDLSAEKLSLFFNTPLLKLLKLQASIQALKDPMTLDSRNLLKLNRGVKEPSTLQAKNTCKYTACMLKTGSLLGLYEK